MKLKTWITENTTAGLVEDICSASLNENLLAFHESGMDAALDTVIKSRQGKWIVDPDYVEDPEDGIEAAEAYLLERNRYLVQILEYFASEYDPIENYSQSEHETIDTTYAERTDHGTDTKAQDTFKHGAHTDQQTFPQYTDTTTTGADGGYNVTTHTAKTKTTTHPGDVTDTGQNAPFESDTFYNKSKNTRTIGEGWESVERIPAGTDGGDDKISYSARKDTVQHGLHTDQYVYPEYSDVAHVGNTIDSYEHITDEHVDGVVRDLSRNGNIGVQTAAQMLTFDEGFWWSFKPLQKLARELAALLTEGVIAL